MKTIKVVIIDDEPLAQNLLESYLLKLPDFHISGKCSNALDALDIINSEQIELLFLDINLPEINGIEFLKTLKKQPKVIFTTAYAEFALESYEFNAIDYLLKPVTFERFLKAINKATDQMQLSDSDNTITNVNIRHSTSGLIFVKTEGKIIKIDLSQLWF